MSLFSSRTDAHIVRWSPDGDKYVVVINDQVHLYDVETASVTGMLTNPKRISSVKFLNVSYLTLLGNVLPRLTACCGQGDSVITHVIPLVFQNSILAVAGDDETVRLCDVGKEEWVCEFKAHETRYIQCVFSVTDSYFVYQQSFSCRCFQYLFRGSSRWWEACLQSWLPLPHLILIS